MRGLLLTACAALALAACDDGASAVETRTRAQAASEGAGSAGGATAAAEAETVAKVEAAPVTANRRETVDAKIQRLYERNGADFGARSAEDYLARVTAFTRNPPSDVERVTRPQNGDVLLYQASTNTFAVVDREGVPRTMFKPREGAAYWEKEKAAAPEFGRRRAD
ncbi:MAG: S-type pyocin family protein [Alphaproteobacteria bacterium]|nr:S-type pyocin family protein [Alphaproteobacteria bacterium]MBU1527227.1 S-type pyocin family protein [Alphaproteobacteria bacterium]MBU2351171.1 S-type pyocin family protein [Alphaproteobacteria bacterium]MBU2381889.1 S-type pyocin family protein [Alphaproteobacteria bacterium]